MQAFTYRDTQTGRKVHSDRKLNDKRYVLVSEVRNGQMKRRKIISK